MGVQGKHDTQVLGSGPERFVIAMTVGPVRGRVRPDHDSLESLVRAVLELGDRGGYVLEVNHPDTHQPVAVMAAILGNIVTVDPKTGPPELCVV